MKHILRINELNKSTYLSAYNKLKSKGHINRSNDILNHFSKTYNEPLDNFDVDKIYYYPFMINGEKCYITNTFHNVDDHLNEIDCYFKSPRSGNEYIIQSNLLTIWYGSQLTLAEILNSRGAINIIGLFCFKTRKEVIQFFKFLREEYPHIEELKKISYNNYYKD